MSTTANRNNKMDDHLLMCCEAPVAVVSEPIREEELSFVEETVESSQQNPSCDASVRNGTTSSHQSSSGVNLELKSLEHDHRDGTVKVKTVDLLGSRLRDESEGESYGENDCGTDVEASLVPNKKVRLAVHGDGNSEELGAFRSEFREDLAPIESNNSSLGDDKEDAGESDDDDTREDEPSVGVSSDYKERKDLGHTPEVSDALISDDGSNVLLSLPSDEGEITGRYYLTGVHYWCFHSSSCGRRIFMCRHCQSVKTFGNPESFAKSISHLTLHLIRDCSCPSSVKLELEQALNIKAAAKINVNEFAMIVWERRFPPWKLETRPSSHRRSGSKDHKPKTTRKRPTATKVEHSDGDDVAETPTSPKRPRRNAAMHALTNMVKDSGDSSVIEEDSSSSNNEPFNNSKARQIIQPKSGPSLEQLEGIIQGITEDGDPWRIIDDGKMPFITMYATIKKYGKDALKAACKERGLETRAWRLSRFVSNIDDSLSRGYDLNRLIGALERIRNGGSVHSFMDHVKEYFEQAEDGIGLGTGTKVKLLNESDPNEHFIEEMAFLYHDPKLPEQCLTLPEEPKVDLAALPDPVMFDFDLDDSDFKSTVKFKWNFDEENRVLLIDFKGLEYSQLTGTDLAFFASMLERDDITVISDGLLDIEALDWDLWDLRMIQRQVGDRVHHKFKRFVQDGESPAIFSEVGQLLEGQIKTFVDYVLLHDSKEHLDNPDVLLNGTGEGNEAVAIDVVKDTVYMIDFDLPRILPRNYDDFLENFKIHEMLPGGKWCMMNSLPKSARPFMGPNLYVTPGGAYTQLHQDGNGTVDSGHVVLSGYNEVVMLRRLPERHKSEASKFLPNRGEYDALYTFPHESGQKPGWPTNETIECWQRMGYCPSVFILKPGQHVHINKGRLHAFRKMTEGTLPVKDCHFTLRQNLLKTENIQKAPLCVSIAWDWQFTGINASAINREVTSSLECQILVDKRAEMKCLAIPKACLLAMGQACLSHVPDHHLQMAQRTKSKPVKNLLPGRDELLRGIAPSLKFVLDQNVTFIEMALNKEDWKLNFAPRNDTALNPLASTVDPDGNDYFCRICSRELENFYLHCDGCEELLQKDFNICMHCYEHGHWRTTIDMVGRGLVSPIYRTSSVNHTGAFCPKSSCTCSNGGKCYWCQRCNACSCTCHQSFTVRRRFYDLCQLKEIMARLESCKVNPLEYGHLTKPRLEVASDRAGAGYLAKRKLIAKFPGLFPLNVDKEEQEAAGSSTDSLPMSVAPTSTSVCETHNTNSVYTAGGIAERSEELKDDKAAPLWLPRAHHQSPHHHSSTKPGRSPKASNDAESEKKCLNLKSLDAEEAIQDATGDGEKGVNDGCFSKESATYRRSGMAINDATGENDVGCFGMVSGDGVKASKSGYSNMATHATEGRTKDASIRKVSKRGNEASTATEDADEAAPISKECEVAACDTNEVSFSGTTDNAWKRIKEQCSIRVIDDDGEARSTTATIYAGKARIEASFSKAWEGTKQGCSSRVIDDEEEAIEQTCLTSATTDLREATVVGSFSYAQEGTKEGCSAETQVIDHDVKAIEEGSLTKETKDSVQATEEESVRWSWEGTKEGCCSQVIHDDGETTEGGRLTKASKYLRESISKVTGEAIEASVLGYHPVGTETEANGEVILSKKERARQERFNWAEDQVLVRRPQLPCKLHESTLLGVVNSSSPSSRVLDWEQPVLFANGGCSSQHVASQTKDCDKTSHVAITHIEDSEGSELMDLGDSATPESWPVLTSDHCSS